MTDAKKTPDQEFNDAIASEESKLALAEMIEENKEDKIAETFTIKAPSNLFDDLEEI